MWRKAGGHLGTFPYWSLSAVSQIHFRCTSDVLEQYMVTRDSTFTSPPSCLREVFLCSEHATLTAEFQRRIQAMEMRCYRRILRISYKDRVTNEEVRAKIRQAIGSHEDLLTNHRKETQTAVVWSCLPFIRSGQNHLARHREKGKKTRQTDEEVGRQHQGKDRPGVRQVQEGSEDQRKKQETGCENMCGAQTTLAVKG